MKQVWAAPDRNKAPILEVLTRVFPKHGTALEISSGSGQHAVHFATHFPALTWIPSDVDDDNLASIRAWVDDTQLANLAPPRRIDVLEPDWGVESVDAVFNANMIHIAPWPCAEGLARGVARILKAQGVFVIYGPFRIAGEHTAPSNAAFDADLKRRNPAWGVRDMEAFASLCSEGGLVLSEHVAMPANNQALVFHKRG